MARLVTIVFVCGLASASAAQSAPRGGVDAGETAAGNPNKVVCKSFTRIGTLADRYRTCKTKAEWERERTNLRELDRSYGCRMNDQAAVPCK
ncbi:MAG TPA: hypothetical protein VF574_10140 [Allosphingosinicella sp.]|jgi:hypothetical protein